MAKTRFTTPTMRFLQGSVDEAQTKDAEGNLRVVKSGPNAGQPNPQFFVSGGVAKGDPLWPAFWAIIVDQAMADFPNLFPYGAAGRDAIVNAGGPTRIPAGYCLHPTFAFKVLDGDGHDRAGKSHAGKEGFAGHWVVRFASSYPPRCFHAGRYAAAEQIQEKNVVRRGYYIRVSGTTEGNGSAQQPGLYLNIDMVELAAYGPEIVSGPDAADAFGAAPATLPAGASATPVGGSAPPPPGAGAPPPAAPPPPAALPPASGPVRPTDPSHIANAGTPNEQWWNGTAWIPAPAGNAPPPPAAPPAAPPSPAAASPAPASAPPPPPAAPYTGFMEPPAAPPAPAAAPPPPPPAASPPPAPIASPGRVMLPAANGSTYEQMIAAGWTDDTLRSHGMMQ